MVKSFFRKISVKSQVILPSVSIIVFFMKHTDFCKIKIDFYVIRMDVLSSFELIKSSY